ncbi:MAG: S-layer homology domain-containing protein, partial [Oscillospiraceae bacterium]|nr:S-layer homology domain-containing protein [Oscillospiraceae bacterium]
DLKTAIHSSWPGADIKAVSGLNSIVTHDYAADEIDPIIIPTDFPDDWTQPITRREFAAVCVQVYENLSGTKALPDVTNPFTDCTDIEVMKAYNVGITNGTSATTFSPDRLLTREEAATMLTRVFKRVTMVGWTLADDSNFTLNYTMPDLFDDDADISGYARDSVYFMAANDIIKGFPGNKFVPRNRTSAEEAEHYANATREQALVIATRMVRNLQ